jgi:hypothetical protein
MGTSIVFKLDLVARLIQGSGFEFWLDHWAVRVNFIFLKKSKRHRFSKKIKVNGFFTRSCRFNQVTPGFKFSYFFLNPAWFQPRIDPSGWAGFQNYGCEDDKITWLVGYPTKFNSFGSWLVVFMCIMRWGLIL